MNDNFHVFLKPEHFIENKVKLVGGVARKLTWLETKNENNEVIAWEAAPGCHFELEPK